MALKIKKPNTTLAQNLAWNVPSLVRNGGLETTETLNYGGAGFDKWGQDPNSDGYRGWGNSPGGGGGGGTAGSRNPNGGNNGGNEDESDPDSLHAIYTGITDSILESTRFGTIFAGGASSSTGGNTSNNGDDTGGGLVRRDGTAASSPFIQIVTPGAISG